MAKRVWSIVLGLLVIPLLAACGADAPAEDPTGANNALNAPIAAEVPVMGPEKRILAFGDSLFAGYGVGVENSYPTKLQNALRARGINAQITNGAVSGDTSAAGAQRVAFLLDAQEAAPDLVIVEFGGNDWLRGISPQETRANIDAILSELAKRNIPALLMGLRSPPNYGPEFQQTFDSLYPELARQYGADLIPFWLESIADKPRLFQDDRVHPTEEGIELIVADTVDDVAEVLD